MVYASMISQRIRVAATTAKAMASVHSDKADFFSSFSSPSLPR